MSTFVQTVARYVLSINILAPEFGTNCLALFVLKGKKQIITTYLWEGKKNNGGKCDLFCTRGGVGGGRQSECTLLRWFFGAQKTFVSLKKAPKQTVCSLPTSDMLDIASNSMFKTSYTISGTSVADTRKLWQALLKYSLALINRPKTC